MSFMKNWMKKGPSKSDVLAKRKRDNEEAIKLQAEREKLKKMRDEKKAVHHFCH